MAVIFYDTDSELDSKLAKELGLITIKMPYTIDEKEYFYDNAEDFDPKWFYEKVRNGSMPTTSALNMEIYKNYFEPYFKKGEEVLYISFSSKMSGTFNYLDMAIEELKKKYPNLKFTRFDTKRISQIMALSVYAAGNAFKAGKSISEIITMLEKFAPLTNALIAVDDLNHLKRGGRLSATSAFFGSILQVKPILRFSEEGELKVTDKINGRNKTINFMVDELSDIMSEAKEYPDLFPETEKLPIIILDADTTEDANKLQEKISEALPDALIWRYSVGPVIGTHCGPGTLAVCYAKIKR